MTSPIRRLTPCGQTRREFLWQTAGGFLGTALTCLLAEDGLLQTAHASPIRNPQSAIRNRNPNFPARAKNVIVLFMYGGVSQVDTWDPKPELTKRHGQPIPNLDKDPLFKVRGPGNLLASSRKFTKWGQSAVEVSDLYPHLGRTIDDICVIRSMYSDSFAHGSGLLQMNTGFVRQGYPSLGSWVTYGLGTENRNLPSYVVMLDHRGGPISGPPNWSSGFMPASFQGTTFRTSGDPILNLRSRDGVTPDQQRQQLDLLNTLNRANGVLGPDRQELMARVHSYELAFRMQASAPEAVDLFKETKETLELYGLNDPITEKFGRKCLIARRLVERGVRFVQCYSGGGHLEDSWDAHSDVDKNHEVHCRETDRPMYALITDLKRRGMLDETLIVWCGEFGRTPTSQNSKGRDHNPRGFSVWMAGGGVKGGQAIGATDDFGYAAAVDKVHIHDLHATILHLLGLDHKLLTYFHAGRNMRLTDVSGEIVKQALG